MNDNVNNQSIIEDQNQYSLKDLFYILRKRMNIILVLLFLFFCLALYYNYSSPAIYRSSSIIMVNKDTSSMSMLSMDFGQKRNFIDNEISILKSRTTGELVVKELLSRGDTLNILRNKKNNSYLSKNLFSFFGINNNSEPIVYDNNTIISISSDLRNAMSISNNRNTDAIKISIKNRDPNEAAYLVNTIVEIYKQQDLSWATGEMSHLKTFLIEQLNNKKIELGTIEKKLESFQKREKIFTVDENATLLLENLTNFESEYNNILALININHEREKYINSQLSEDEKKLSKDLSNTINERLLSLKMELSLLEDDKISTIIKYGEGHSVLDDLNNKILDTKNRIENETRFLIEKGISVADPIKYRQGLMDSLISIKALKATLDSRAESFENIINTYSAKLSDLPEKVLEYSRLERERSVQAQTYKFMSQKLEESRIGEASKLSKIRVIDTAIPNNNPISPKKAQNLLYGLGLGLLIGISISILLELIDNTIRTIEQIERRGLQILVLIPSISSDSNSKRKTNKYLNKNVNIDKLQRRLITQEDPKSPISEAYRGLRTSLMYDELDSKCNVILVSSPGPGEGKTTTVANLAITYANLGKKTLLIDSDLRKPVMHNVFNIDKSPGLTSYLVGDSDYSKVIKNTEVDNLDVITSGVIPPNPSEIIDSKKMSKLINDLSSKYDMILFDSPPLIAVTDAFILMKYIKQFILVVRAGVSEKGALDRVITTTHQSGKKITGVVMNAISKEHSYGTGYYYNYYQYYYGDTEKNS